MADTDPRKGKPQKDFSTWMGFEVKPSEHYPDRVFVAVSENGIAALEACYEDWYWAAKVRVDNFVGQAMSTDRATARAEAERKLLEVMAQDPEGLLELVARDVFAILNPALLTGDTSCLN
jgi:hypothetical protein